MKLRPIAALAVAVLMVACGGSEDTDGLPDTETTGSAQSPGTSTLSANTTAPSGGTSTTVSPADGEWVVKAGMTGLAEVQMANLALQKAQNVDVKSFAQRMVADHSKANEELQQIVTAKGLALPTDLEGDPENALAHLNSLSGAEFDKAYMQHMVADHDKAVALLTEGSTSVQDPDIKAFAAKSLPVVQEHARLAKELSGKV